MSYSASNALVAYLRKSSARWPAVVSHHPPLRPAFSMIDPARLAVSPTVLQLALGVPRKPRRPATRPCYAPANRAAKRPSPWPRQGRDSSVSLFARNRVSRLAITAVLVAGSSLLAASPAWAFDSFVIPARDNGCAVDLRVEVDHLEHARISNGDIKITNLENGKTYLQRSRYTESETFDPTTRTLHVTVAGNYWWAFLPGDIGPSGEVVQEPGIEWLFSGSLEYTMNKKGVVIAFSYKGTYQDLCALLS